MGFSLIAHPGTGPLIGRGALREDDLTLYWVALTLRDDDQADFDMDISVNECDVCFQWAIDSQHAVEQALDYYNSMAQEGKHWHWVMSVQVTC